MVKLNIDLPEHFLDEEIRCDYTVTHEMKEVWAVELDLLNKITSVCNENNLHIFADAGTLLGAVRHHGFIPWDDDIDLCMFRDDYDKLVELSQTVFDRPYFLQTAYTDIEYSRGHAQFRRSDTTGILQEELALCKKFNQGIFLDIFVLDGVTKNKIALQAQKRKIMKNKRLIDLCLKVADGCGRKAKIAKKLLSMLKIDWLELYKNNDKSLRNHSVQKCENVAPLNFIFETKKRIRNKHLYDNTVWLDFENTKIPAPQGYDEFLTKRYGDYMKPAKVPTTHGGTVFSANIPYTEILGKNIIL